jgi:hypothetical protein
MSKLIIHIGAHKTATTTIQKMLLDNANHLKARGLIYPRVCWYHYAQHRLSFALKEVTDPVRGDRPDPETEIGQVNEFARCPGQVLISSEALFSLKRDAVTFLKDRLQFEQVKILAFVRRPDEMLLSIYNQKNKGPAQGFTRPLEFYVNRPRQIDPDINYAEQLGNWADVFGADAVDLRTYEAGPPVETFFSALGLAAPEGRQGELNCSVPAAVVELMRLAKAFNFDHANQRALYELATRHFQGAERVYLSDEARVRIISHFQAENDALFASFHQDNPYRAESYTPVEPNGPRPNLSHRDLMGLVETLLASSADQGGILPRGVRRMRTRLKRWMLRRS